MDQQARAETGGKPGAKPPPRERILKAADELFERHGIRAVGVEAIADAAETNKMTLYRHFSSKDELIAVWLQGLTQCWWTSWNELDVMPESLSPREKIDLFIDRFGDAFEQFAQRGCPMMNSLAELRERDHPARRVLDEHKAQVRERISGFFESIGISDPAQAAEEIQLLMDGAKAGVADLGVKRSRERFAMMAKQLLETRLT